MIAKFVTAFAMVWAAVALPSRCLAWGGEGHEIVALIARGYLAPSVRAQVDYLLSLDQDRLTPPDMASRATWADAWRRTHPETTGWHFINLELSAPNLAEACGGRRSCLVKQLDRFEAELARKSTPQGERIFALKMVLHLVGDLHQPLHAADNHDGGGNCERVRYTPAGLFGIRRLWGSPLLELWGSHRQETSLHGHWDSAAVEALGRDPMIVAEKLRDQITREDVLAWSAGTPGKWAAESFKIARDQVYAFDGPAACMSGRVTDLTAAYQKAARQIVQTQLERAGVRLATELNRALSPPELSGRRHP